MLNMLQTTSPSYLLLASMDYASYFMESQGKEEIYRVVSLTEQYMGLIDEIHGLKAVRDGSDGKSGYFRQGYFKIDHRMFPAAGSRVWRQSGIWRETGCMRKRRTAGMCCSS